jgi:hypothetical protein
MWPSAGNSDWPLTLTGVRPVRRARQQDVAVDDGGLLVESAQARWRAITGAHLVSLVRAGARFENGALIERKDQVA